MDETLRSLVPAIAVAVAWTVAILGFRWLLLTRPGVGSRNRPLVQLALVVLGLFAFVSVLFALPLDDSWRSNLPALLGLGLSALLGLASTTLIANIMAGLMLRLVAAFRVGDFIRIDTHFGRVSEQGLLHTEIQTEDRDLLTLPNTYVISNPTRVVRSSGTIISAEISLGYDIDHAMVEPLLAAAVRRSGLTDAIVQVKELLDHAVLYRVAGFLDEPKQMVTSRSVLRANILDTLHGAGVEIVSPSYMFQRPMDPADRVVPDVKARAPRSVDRTASAEAVAFDKADSAERLRQLKRERKAAHEALAALESGNGTDEDGEVPSEAAKVEELARLRAELLRLDGEIADLEQDPDRD